MIIIEKKQNIFIIKINLIYIKRIFIIYILYIINMNSIHKLCVKIDSDIQDILKNVDSLTKKVDTIEKKLEIIEKNINKSQPKIQKDKVISLSKQSNKKVKKLGSIDIKEYNDCILICGDTFDKKAIIKKYKGLWNPEHRGWTVQNKKYKELLIKNLEKVTKNVDVESINNTLLKKNTKHNDKHSDGEYDNHTERMNIPSTISFLEDD